MFYKYLSFSYIFMVDVAGFTFVIHIGWLVVYGNAGRPSVSLSVVRPSEICCQHSKIFICWNQLISNLHTHIILGISSLSSEMGNKCLPKHIKISKYYNFNENWYLEDFLPAECESDKCDLKMAAIAAIMVAILAAIFNMVAKTHKQFRSAPMLQLQRNLIFMGF